VLLTWEMTDMLRIAVLDDYQGAARELANWTAIDGSTVEFFDDTLADAGALVERLAPYDVLVTMRERTRFPASILERLPNLKLVSGTGRRQAHLDLHTATRLGIVVTGTGSPGDSTAELAWGLIIAATRNIAWEDARIREGRWQTRLGSGLRGKTLGILGMGRLGSAMAKISPAFGMDVIAWGPTLTPERAEAGGAKYVAWDELFSRADVISIHVPLTDLSRGWVGARELALMKPTAYLINTSRGAIVQTDALVAALRERRVAGAAIDVYDEEPLPATHPLLGLDNVVLTPHLGYATRETLEVFYGEAAANVRAWQAGTPTQVLNEAVLGSERR